MKIIILPSMNGTAALLDEFVSCLGYEHDVLELPVTGSQSYSSIIEDQKTIPVIVAMVLGGNPNRAGCEQGFLNQILKYQKNRA